MHILGEFADVSYDLQTTKTCRISGAGYFIFNKEDKWPMSMEFLLTSIFANEKKSFKMYFIYRSEIIMELV